MKTENIPTPNAPKNPETPTYDAWFRAKVKKSLDGLKDGSNPIIPDEEWQAKRAAWEREARQARKIDNKGQRSK